jgi:hypothetical protein
MRSSLLRLCQWLLAPWHGLRALVQLPSLLRQWHTRLETQELLIRELTDLHRELLTAIGAGPQTPQTPETPRLPPTRTQTAPEPSTDHPLTLTEPPPPPDPHRLRTDRDVTYSSRSFLHEQDARAAAEQAPWRRPGTR